MRTPVPFALAIALASFAAPAYADDRTSSPYIDAIRKKLDAEKPAPTGSYTESVKKTLSDDEKSSGYSDLIREQLLKKEAQKAVPEGPASFTEREKQRLGPSESGGAIQAVREGKSELKAKREGEIHHAAGFRYGASLTREITAAAGAGATSFNTIYNANYAPDLTLFYEYQPFHSEWFGNVGIVSSLGVGYYHGNGQFGYSVPKSGGGTFPTESRTKFQFFTIPVMVGLDYRFNLLRILRPFVMAGPTLIGYVENRNDNRDSFRGYSKGVFFSGGVSILMDWISGDSSWEQYASNGIKHSYLTVDYSRLSTFSGDVSVAVSGLYAGMTFEF